MILSILGFLFTLYSIYMGVIYLLAFTLFFKETKTGRAFVSGARSVIKEFLITMVIAAVVILVLVNYAPWVLDAMDANGYLFLAFAMGLIGFYYAMSYFFTRTRLGSALLVNALKWRKHLLLGLVVWGVIMVALNKYAAREAATPAPQQDMAASARQGETVEVDLK